jgi:hypothetical protein
MVKRAKEGQEEEAVQLRLRWQDHSQLPTLYANQVYMTHAGNEFYVIFGEVQLPVLVNVTPETISPIVDAMAENVRKFLERQERREEKEEN